MTHNPVDCGGRPAAIKGFVSSDAGTTDMMLKRKFRIAWKALRRSFKHASVNAGRAHPGWRGTFKHTGGPLYKTFRFFFFKGLVTRVGATAGTDGAVTSVQLRQILEREGPSPVPRPP